MNTIRMLAARRMMSPGLFMEGFTPGVNPQRSNGLGVPRAPSLFGARLGLEGMNGDHEGDGMRLGALSRLGMRGLGRM